MHWEIRKEGMDRSQRYHQDESQYIQYMRADIPLYSSETWTTHRKHIKWQERFHQKWFRLNGSPKHLTGPFWRDQIAKALKRC